MLICPELSKLIVDAFYEVCRNLSAGYAEKVYERALVYELRLRGLKVEEQYPLRVLYKGQLDVGNFVADIVVNDAIILEIKAVSSITPSHTAQLINYLTATGIKIGYVLNFGSERKFERRLGPSAINNSQFTIHKS